MQFPPGLGATYSELKQYGNAVPALREALRLKPNDLRTLNALGTAYMFSDQHADALATFQQAIRLKPDEAVFYYHLGMNYCFMGKKDDALGVQRKLQSMNQKLGQALLDLINKTQ